ncbi:(2Fe-2S)-binding protein [Marinomonas transparens]|uniref:(2Fe-2S)-binding protein n=1 Tax=Marinomonas transparens TaxID=2795388 RepID=A0A934JRH0_9GAMM|nr:(2Fe-2S)-binding protein [Marinomonas transparens]MBJ7536075.1 (2Fe-2S)-binding protein [Marinomonas transparens]
MPTDSRFNRQPIRESEAIQVSINGKKVMVQPNDSVAAAILLSGVDVNRKTPVSGKKRAPYCMMGVCFDCLVRVNGEENIQGCMVKVEANMDIQTQDGTRQAIK